jgi:bla regulator protein blaR1
MHWLAALTPWMLPVWLTGVVVCSLRLVMASLHTVTLKRRSVPEDGPLAAAVSRLAARIGVGRAVSVRVSTVMASPATLGFLRPVILLPPATALGVTPQQLEALLAPELAHVRGTITS